MKELLFKAKLLNGKGWVYGMPTYDMKYIFNSDQNDSPDNYEIDPLTLCQYTGFENDSDQKFFHDDVARVFNGLEEEWITGCIKMHGVSSCLVDLKTGDVIVLWNSGDIQATCLDQMEWYNAEHLGNMYDD